MRRYAGVGISVVALALSVALVREWRLSAQAPADPKTSVAATVNGERITLEEVDALLKPNLQLQPATTSQLRQWRIEILTGMIDELLLRQFLRESGPKIDPGEIDRRFSMLEAAQKEQKKSMRDYLREANRTEAQIRSGIESALQLDGYLKERTTDVELKKYYETNKDYFDKVAVRTSHIAIRVAVDAPESERVKARQKLQSIRDDVSAGKIDFASAAKQFSDCPSAPKGGDVGYIFRKWQNVDEIYARTAFGMKVGTLSEVVETDYGAHLIRVTDRKEGKASRFEDCIEEVRDSYKEELRQGLLKEQRKKAKVVIAVP